MLIRITDNVFPSEYEVINPDKICRLSIRRKDSLFMVVAWLDANAANAFGVGGLCNTFDEAKQLREKLLRQINSRIEDKDEVDCTCDLYGYCKACGREGARPDHLFKTEGETK